MIVLGIESSCDETAIAVVRNGREVLSSCVSSQIEQHSRFGGVVPEIAAREHLKAIDPLFRQALADAQLKAQDVDAIAVTQGPGLIGALLVGISFAKGLASALQKPLIPVDHVHAHLHGAFLGLPAELALEDLFPCLGLVVSGGHTNLYSMNDPTSFQLLAATIDDACGECFDKVAKLWGLGYPGGPVIEKLARQGDSSKVGMPRMVAEKSKLAFSYSGLKTHMVYLARKKDEHSVEDVCASFQEEALGQLVRKIEIAYLRAPQKPRSLVIAGGVAANQRFRDLVRGKIPVESYFPGLKYCSDNAAMIAALGWHEFQKRQDRETFLTHAWDAYARYKFELQVPT